MDDELRRAQRRVEEAPDDAAARRAYAEALLLAGLRAAAWRELEAARSLGAEITPAVAARFGARECPKCDEHGQVCADCEGTGLCPDSLDNYHYDPYGMAPCRCDGVRTTCPDCHGARFLP